ncbi:GGDEF domain-containing protein [Candidatus Saccharibacteria bacterium]|nr:GGDEF domain-containing protein [Candidatus Saccharibacteria bacterium]
MTNTRRPDYSQLNDNLNKLAEQRRSVYFEDGLPSADRLNDLAFRDSLTGLLNREGFKRQIKNWKDEQPSDVDSLIALAYIDLNNFKAVNDRLGHDFGDQALKDIAEILRQNLRDTDMIARWGGDEIVIGLPVRTEEINHEHVFEALDETLNGSLRQAEQALALRDANRNYLSGISFAIGVEVYQSQDLDQALEVLLKTPDERMYDHKISGRL